MQAGGWHAFAVHRVSMQFARAAAAARGTGRLILPSLPMPPDFAPCAGGPGDKSQPGVPGFCAALPVFPASLPRGSEPRSRSRPANAHRAHSS